MQIKVRVSQDESARINDLAKACGLASSTLLRNLGLGYQPKSTLDLQAIEQLARLHGDLRRIGGFLKLWLTMPQARGRANGLEIRNLIDQLKALKREICAVASRL